MKQWFEVNVLAGATQADIYIFGVIGGWVDDFYPDDAVLTAKTFADALAKLPPSVKALKVRINSPGGDVYGSIAIANTLRAEQANGRSVETVVEGLAASGASLVAMAGSAVRIADNALFMVHAPWTIVVGNAKEMRSAADYLDQLRDTLVKTYQWHCPLEPEEIDALIEGEEGQGTWMDADEAIANGFCTEKIEGLRAAASIDQKSATKLSIPERFAARVAELLRPEGSVAEPETPALEESLQQPAAAAAVDPDPAPASGAAVPTSMATLIDIFPVCKAAGLDAEFMESLVGCPRVEVQARVAAEQTRRRNETARRDGIAAMCSKGKLASLADHLIEGGTSLEAARAIVGETAALMDKVEIDATLTPAGSFGAQKPVINTRALYAERNKRSTH